VRRPDLTELLRCGALLFALHGALAAADEVHRFDWLTSGRVSGHHVLTIRSDGTREVDFGYKDRGRGPQTSETIRFDAAGKVVAIDVEGEAYMGGPVEEHFRREGAAASWDSLIESGESQSAGDAFYVTGSGSFENMAILARALLDTPQHSLPLLPSGRAAIDRLVSTSLGPEGGRREVTLYAISGLDLLPSYLWLDENRELFALSVYWMGMVPEGWAAYLPDLQKLQQAAEARYHGELSARLTRRLPARYRVQDVHVVDVAAGRVLDAGEVAVQDGRIVSVGSPAPADFGGEVIDGHAGYLVPGLWDMHTHLGLEQGIQHIAAGVTTVRDMGNNPEEVQHVREQFSSGGAIGPHVLAAGFISPYSAPIGKLVDSQEEALQMVREYHDMGYPQIKLYSSIEPQWVPAIAAETHRLGMRLSGHVPNGMTAEAAVREGYDEIQHINMLFLNFLAGPDVDTRTPARVTLVAEKGGSLDLDSPEVQSFIGLLAQRRIVIDPTVALFDGMLRHRPGEYNPSYAMIADHLPPTVRRGMLNPIMEVSEANAATYARGAAAMVEMVGRLYRAGVPLVAGTDAMPGFLYDRELELYRQAGIPAAEVLRIATLGAARVMGLDASSGSIEAGKQADLVLLGDNPLEDISAVRRPRLVIKGREAWRPAELDRAMGIEPFVDDKP